MQENCTTLKKDTQDCRKYWKVIETENQRAGYNWDW